MKECYYAITEIDDDRLVQIGCELGHVSCGACEDVDIHHTLEPAPPCVKCPGIGTVCNDCDDIPF